MDTVSVLKCEECNQTSSICICADAPTRSLLKINRIRTKCSKKTKAILFIVTLCSIIAIISVVTVFVNRPNNKNQTIDHTQQSIPKSTTAKLTTININKTHSPGSRYCMNSTECSNQEIIANTIFCFNSATCSHSELISLSETGSINCISDQACYSANLLFANGQNSQINCFGFESCLSIANGVKIFGNLYCKGIKSCYNLSPSILANQVQCSGKQSCASDGMSEIVYHAQIMNCSGDWSCTNSIIYAKQVHIYSEMYPIKNSEIIAKNTDILDIYLYNDLSGSFGNIRCKNESICNVYCYSIKACENMNIFVDNDNVTMNIECDNEVICPNVWYNDHDSNAVGTNIEFDNTQLFRDNNGFILNDEMFDVGRDWVLNGNFNFNLVIQNYNSKESEESKQNDDKSSLTLNSNIKQLLNKTSLSIINDSNKMLNNAFDNTQLFRDNTGFVLNDEMFDIGQNWNSEGDFNLNITFQNFGDNSNDQDRNSSDDKRKRLLDIESLQF